MEKKVKSPVSQSPTRSPPADVHELLARLDQVHGVLPSRHAGEPLHVQVAATDVRRDRQNLLRRQAGQAAGADRRGLDHALHGQEIRVPTAGNGRQRRPRRRRRADHPRTGQDDPRRGHRLRQSARRGDGRPAGPVERRGRHLRQHRRRHGSRPAHSLRNRHRPRVALRRAARRADRGPRRA